jgi:hypothetical protein
MQRTDQPPILDRGATRARPARAASIPRILHCVWVGPGELPARDAAFVEGWKRLHPGWELRAWTEETIDFAASAWLKRAYAMRAWNRVSDFVRMDCLVRHGGVYLDTDIELLKPLDPLLDDGCFLGYQADAPSPHWTLGPHWVNSAVVGATRGHWFPRAVLRHITTRVSGEESGAGLTGPGAVTRILLDAGMPPTSPVPVRIDDLTVYPRQFFYPWGQDGPFDPAAIRPETFATHHWAATWVAEYRRWSLRKKLRMRIARYMPGLAFAMTRAAVRRERRRLSR